MKFYSKTTGGFYDGEIHGESMPSDAVEITDEVHSSLLVGQSVGKIISASSDGSPTLTNPAPLTLNQQIIIDINKLQSSITPRMVQEASIGSTLTGLGENKDKTAAQYIAETHVAISALRAKLV